VTIVDIFPAESICAKEQKRLNAVYRDPTQGNARPMSM
jgi:hypothetical protein